RAILPGMPSGSDFGRQQPGDGAACWAPGSAWRRLPQSRDPLGNGAETITGRSLVNDRAICPNRDFPDGEIHERVPESETIRATRISLSLFGDGFVEAVADQTLIDLAQNQCAKSGGAICGQTIQVPVVEAVGATRVGRFGWKNQHASL